MEKQQQIKLGQKIWLTIKRLGINGEGIGYHLKTIVFVPNALPKEKIQIEVTQVERNYAVGKLIHIKKNSTHRIAPPCKVYEECGGCQLQHLAYSEQLRFKKDLIQQSLAKFKPVGYQNFKILPTIGMSEPWHYRNKAQFQIRKNSKNQVVTGLYQPNSHHLVPIDDCLVQYPYSTKIINYVVSLAEKLEIPIFNEKKKSGILKTLMIRESLATKQCQVVLITHSKKLPQKKQLILGIQENFKDVVSIMQNVQSQNSSRIMGEESILLWGKEDIDEELNEVTFQLSSTAFFQLNTVQTLRLYDEVKTTLNIQPNETLVDAYCGVGTIGLYAAQKAKEIRGMDVIPSAIQDAKENARALNIKKSHYEVGQAEEVFPKWRQQGFRPDAIIVDPPRTGLDQKLLQYLTKYPVKKLIYVSCNPSTLARDLGTLAKTYDVGSIQPLDMFPQTARIEVITSLSCKN